MPRQLAPCGTFTAYKRHKRRHEVVDEACAQAARDQANDRTAQKRREQIRAVQANVSALPPAESAPRCEVDPLEDAVANLKIVKAAMAEATPREIAALSKQRVALVGLVQRLQAAAAKQKGGLKDDLKRAREAREARRSATSH